MSDLYPAAVEFMEQLAEKAKRCNVFTDDEMRLVSACLQAAVPRIYYANSPAEAPIDWEGIARVLAREVCSYHRQLGDANADVAEILRSTEAELTAHPRQVNPPGAAQCGPGMNDRNQEIPMNESKQRPVLVTTAHRGVFFGYAEGPTDGEQIVLKQARCCVMWRGVKGFLGLASSGPTSACRVGPPADITLRAITAVAEVTPEAVTAWEKAPWA